MRPKVLIIGGGPAGAACAVESRRRGLETVLFEKGGPNREKICGDALLPDALKCLGSLGLLEKIKRKARAIPHFFLRGPRGEPALVPAPFLTLQRSEFDRMLRETAEEEGTSIHYDSAIIAVEIRENGVTVCDQAGREYEGDVLVFATGASAKLPCQAGFPMEAYSGIAMRAYLSNPRGYTEAVGWVGRNVSNAYAWIFPCPGDILNVGVGISFPEPLKNGYLHNLFKNFVKNVANGLLEGASFLETPKGFPLRAGLKKKKIYGDRVLLVGETAHSTYELTGDGIGPAMVSGVLAAITLAGAERRCDESQLGIYQNRLNQRLGRLHKGYRRARHFYKNPVGFYLFTKLIQYSPQMGALFAQVLNEEQAPDRLFSFKGFFKNLFNGSGFS